MKHFGNTLEFTRQRNDDIMRAFRHQISVSKSIRLPDIYQRVAQSPASRFWVSEERAAIVISRMVAGKPLPRMLPTKREMFDEIYRRYLLMKPHHPDISLPELVSIIVNQPAPKFYFTARTVGEFIYRIRTGWYNKSSHHK